MHIQTQVSKGENKSGRPNLERRLVSKSKEGRGEGRREGRGRVPISIRASSYWVKEGIIALWIKD